MARVNYDRERFCLKCGVQRPIMLRCEDCGQLLRDRPLHGRGKGKGI